MSYSDLVVGGQQVLGKAVDLLRHGGGSDSLIGFTQVGRVEPLCMIDQAALHLDCIGDVQQSMLAVFAGYYLQAASLSNSLGSIRVLDRLDALNPNRDPAAAALNRVGLELGREAIDDNLWMVTTEAYQTGLPFLSDKRKKQVVEKAMRSQSFGLATEAQAGKVYRAVTGASAAEKYAKDAKASADKADKALQATKDAINNKPFVQQALSKQDIGKTLNELVNLSVGRSYEINITDGKNTIPVQVNIRLIASMLATKDMIHILATGSDDNSWKERWHGWKSGRLGFWKDLVMCNDLIDKHRTDLNKDRSGTLASINGTTLGNQLSTLISFNPTISSSTNLVVITKDTAEQLELQLEGKLSNFTIRHRMMKKTALMIMAVIDEDYQTLTMYHRGIPLPTTVRLKDLKASSKGGGADIGDILKSLMGGHPPSL